MPLREQWHKIDCSGAFDRILSLQFNGLVVYTRTFEMFKTYFFALSLLHHPFLLSFHLHCGASALIWTLLQGYHGLSREGLLQLCQIRFTGRLTPIWFGRVSKLVAVAASGNRTHDLRFCWLWDDALTDCATAAAQNLLNILYSYCTQYMHTQ